MAGVFSRRNLAVQIRVMNHIDNNSLRITGEPQNLIWRMDWASASSKQPRPINLSWNIDWHIIAVR